MKKKVAIKLMIFLIIFIIIIGAGLAYAYFSTDFLKTNDQLFFKYLGQAVESEDGFINSSLKDYFKKKRTEKYEDNGNFYVDINISDLDADMLQTINDFNIDYSGVIDNTTRKNEQEITINYSDEVNFPFKYKYANETLGLQTDYVSSKYIGIENNNLKEFAEKIGLTNTEDIPDTIDLFSNLDNTETFNFTDEEREQIKDRYKSILEEKLKDKEFVKTEENETINYSVDMTNQELKDIIIEFLETIKNDSILMPKIEEATQELLKMMSENSDEEYTVQSIIDNCIDELNNNETEEGNVSVIVSQTNQKLSGITLKNEENEIKLTKTDVEGNLTYNFEANIKDKESEDTTKYMMSASYKGLEQMASVNEIYQTGIIATVDGKEQKMVYNLNCTDSFKNDIDIQDYSDDEIQTLNEYDSEQISTLLTGITERIVEVNNMQMEEIGFSEYGNPMIYAFPGAALQLMMYNQATDVMDEEWSTGTEYVE